MEKYITESFSSFDPVGFLDETTKNLNKEAAEDSFERAIDHLVSDTNQPYNIVNWCLEVKNNNYEIIKTDETLYYWIIRIKTTTKLQNKLNKAFEKNVVAQRITEIGRSVNSKLKSVSNMKRKDKANRVGNDKVLFGKKSVGKIIKNFGEDHFEKYHNLTKKQKKVVGLCLNSIIDIFNETKDSQRQIFTEGQ